VKVHLLHTNDVHSQVERHIQLGHALRTLRQQLEATGDVVLTFDIGDTLDRVRPETEATMGQVNAALLNALHVDGWVFGNNEGLTISPNLWPQLVGRAGTTAFGTNLRQHSGEPFPFFLDVQVYETAQVKVGAFGLTPNYILPYNMMGVIALEPVEAALRAVQELRDVGCAIVVCLSHLGLHEDRRLAAEVAGIDVILGGHTHQFMQQAEWISNTAIFQPGKHGQVFGHTVITYDVAAQQVMSVDSTPVSVGTQDPPDVQMLSAYRGYLPDITQRLSETVACLEHPLVAAYDCESTFANFVADALYETFPCDVTIIAAGALTASLRRGKIAVEHVLGACSTPTRPLTMTLSGQEIEEIIRQGIQAEFYLQKGWGYGFRGSVVGYLAVSNMRVLLSIDETNRPRLEGIRIGKENLDRGRDYRITTSEYLFLSPVIPVFAKGRDVSFHEPLVREVLLETLGNQQLCRLAQEPRYVNVHD